MIPFSHWRSGVYWGFGTLLKKTGQKTAVNAGALADLAGALDLHHAEQSPSSKAARMTRFFMA